MAKPLSQNSARAIGGLLFLFMSIVGFWIPIHFDIHGIWKIILFGFSTIWGLTALRVLAILIFPRQK